MKKVILSTILSVGLASSYSQTTYSKQGTPPPPERKTAPNSEDLRNHVVFLIHGIGGRAGTDGNNGTFCNVDGIRDRLNTDLTRSPIKVESIGYSTDDPKKNTDDFSKEIAEQIQTYFRTNRSLNRLNTTYSIIAHSQGGLVTMRYIKNCLADGLCGDLSTVPALTKVTTLGTPFWGSPNATNLHDPQNLTSQLREFMQGGPTLEAAPGARGLQPESPLPDGVSSNDLLGDLRRELGLTQENDDAQLEALPERANTETSDEVLKSKIGKALREIEGARQSNISGTIENSALADGKSPRISLESLESAAQLADLTTISRQIVKTRRELVQSFTGEDKNLAQVIKEIEFINIGGEIRQQLPKLTGLSATARFILYWSAGKKEETDMVVPVPSSQLSFISYRFEDGKLKPNTTGDILKTRSLFFPVAHTEFGGRLGMACYDQKADSKSGPESRLWTAIARNYSTSAEDFVAPRLSGFKKPRTYSYEIRVKADKSVIEDLRIVTNDGAQIKDGTFSQVNLNRFIDLKKTKKKAALREHVFTSTGQLGKDRAHKAIRFKVVRNSNGNSVLDWQTIEVHAGKSTFVDIDLRPAKRKN